MKISRSSYFILHTPHSSRCTSPRRRFAVSSEPKRSRGGGGGFTLVEMMVALAIFSIVAVVALGALVKIVSANHKAQTLQASMTNLNFALDSMSREIRVGTGYFCDPSPRYGYDGSSLFTQPCNAPSSANSSVALAFVSSKVDPSGNCNLAYAYRFIPTSVNASTWRMQKAIQPNCTTPINNGNGTPGSFFDILDPNVTITGYFVRVTQVSGDNYPLATIRISGFAGNNEKEKTTFDVQTSVSARIQ